jgi:putative flippase GtrA
MYFIKIYHENKNFILRFLTVGIFCALLYFSSFFLLWKTFQLDYHVAISIAYVLSVIAYFFASRHFTFKTHGSSIGPQLAKFIVSVVLNYVLTLVIIHLSVELLMLQPYTGSMLAIGGTTLTNYIIARWWVFKSLTT